MTVMSFIYATLKKCRNWKKIDLNTILTNGDNYFKFCYENGPPTNDGFLEIDRVLGNYYLFDKNYQIKYYEHEDGYLRQSLMTQENLIHELCDFAASNAKFAAYTANGYTFGILKEKQIIFFFDSHAKDLNGYFNL